MEFLDLLVPFILVDYVKPVDEFLFSFNSQNWYLIKIAVVDLIFYLLNILSTGFVIKPLRILIEF